MLVGSKLGFLEEGAPEGSSDGCTDGTADVVGVSVVEGAAEELGSLEGLVVGTCGRFVGVLDCTTTYVGLGEVGDVVGCDGDAVGSTVGAAVVGVTVGAVDGANDGTVDGMTDGTGEGLAVDGLKVDRNVGSVLGEAEGDILGIRDGFTVRVALGATDGLITGVREGLPVEGHAVGA